LLVVLSVYVDNNMDQDFVPCEFLPVKMNCEFYNNPKAFIHITKSKSIHKKDPKVKKTFSSLLYDL